jgi:hypothetical protein
MNRQQKRKFRKVKARQNRIRKHGGLKFGYSDYQIDCYVYHLLDLLR